MKKISSKRRRMIFSVLFFIISVLIFTTCNKEEETEDCITRTKRDQYFGYEVWAGDSALWKNVNSYDFYYNIDKYYTLIGTGTTTKTFNTADYKYYVIAAKWYCCIDAIMFADGTLFDWDMKVGDEYATLISGLAEHPPGGEYAQFTARFYGEPDGISGNLGYKDLCKEPNSFGGFITDNLRITSRGKGLTIFISGDCN